jgi:ATP-dependent HslUV protease ATP-binding subunit HslU
MAKPSDLIPELQGRFPIRVELSKLTVDDFVKIVKPSRSDVVRILIHMISYFGDLTNSFVRKFKRYTYVSWKTCRLKRRT